MRTIPGMTILSPADGNEAKACVRAAAEFDGPVYLRFGRMPVPMIFDDDYKIEIEYSGWMQDEYSLFEDAHINAHKYKFESKLIKINEREASLGFDYIFVNQEPNTTIRIII
jgi:deoxyxylulose-5-phosphate synthase